MAIDHHNPGKASALAAKMRKTSPLITPQSVITYTQIAMNITPGTSRRCGVVRVSRFRVCRPPSLESLTALLSYPEPICGNW